MDTNQPPTQNRIDLPGIQQRSAGIAGKWRLLIVGGAIAIGAIYGALHHPQEKTMAADGSLVRPGPDGGLVFTNRTSDVTFPLPAEWKLAPSQQKTDEALLQNADNSCRLLVMHAPDVTDTATFQTGMSRQLVKDGHSVTPPEPARLGTLAASRVQVRLQNGNAEQIYTAAAGGGLYSVILVYDQGCDADFTATLNGFRP